MAMGAFTDAVNGSSSPSVSPCQACGVCCAYSAAWPRFSTETDEALARIPAALVHPSQTRMLCIGDRCSALIGELGVATACTIYADRPDVCRACEPGDEACTIARERYGLAALPWPHD